MLPEVDGWRVAEELAEKPETREIPILFLSARSDRADESRAHALGGVGYITKPFDPLALPETVRSALERTRRGEREQMRSEWARSLEQDD
jgi:putative two-component system response regulator